MESLTLAVGADHAGFGLKAELAAMLTARGHTVRDLGTHGTESVDYPDFARAVCRAVLDGGARFGVLVCGTGTGISISANRHRGIRCALVHDVTGARLAREHNDANVIAFGARMIGPVPASDALDAFLTTPFAGGRHACRVALIDALPEPAP
jgi:ribose 5-phosphate isomerase B